MEGVEHASSDAVADRDPRLVFASIAALVLVTGSTFVWLHKKVRSKPDLKAAYVVLDTYPEIQSSDPPPSEKAHAIEQASEEAENRQDAGVANADSEVKEVKSARSKERRKRRKDPLKTILKGGKKNKNIQRLVKSLASDDPVKVDPQHPMDYQDDYEGMSSRSSSAASRTSQGKSTLSLETHISDETGTSTSGSSSEYQQEAHATQDTTISASASEPSFHSAQNREDHPTSLPTSRSDCNHLHEREAEFSGPPSFGYSLSSSSASCCDSTSDLHSPSTKATSPSPSLNLEIPRFLRTSQSLPSNASSMIPNDPSSSRSPRAYETGKPPSSSFQVAQDWDGSSTAHSPTYTKPPRFRPQAKHIPISISASPLAGPTPYLSQYYTPYSPPPTSPSHPLAQTSTEATDAPNFVFPTLNPPSNPSSPPPSARLTGNVGTIPVRCTSPPHSSSPVSAQTQIASLRGALEAARLREEKSKQRAEKLARDYETLKRKWGEELYNWRGKEASLQAQVSHLTHQLQAYAAFFVSMSPAMSPVQMSTFHPQAAPCNHTHQQPPYIPQHSSSPPAVSPYVTPVHSVLGSPTGPGSPQVPFAMYQNPPPPNLFSLFFPGSTSGTSGGGSGGANGSAPASASASISGSSSAESISPVLDNLPRWNRGRRPRKGMKRTAGEHEGRSGDELEPKGDDDDDDTGGENAEGGAVEVSGLLADAILRRPESLGAKTGSRVSGDGGDVVFTFPSLSNLGNVEPLAKGDECDDNIDAGDEDNGDANRKNDVGDASENDIGDASKNDVDRNNVAPTFQARVNG